MYRPEAAIVGSGNIGTDLMHKLMRSTELELRWMVGIDPESQGLAAARRAGLEVASDGVEWLLSRADRPQIVFEATSARVHSRNARQYAMAGIRAIDLTPAAVGPYVVPSVNGDQHLDAPNLNMVTCGGQATVPLVHAVAGAAPVAYAEIVASIASLSAGPGTRQNIDEFTRTTAHSLEVLGLAVIGKAIIILNPADPPVLMRDTVYCTVPGDADEAAITASVTDRVAEIAQYVPGYRLLAPPQFERDQGDLRVAIYVEVEGAGDSLPSYAGNLDIMTAAAARTGDIIARSIRSASMSVG